MQERRTSLRDVAQAVGVSVQTVSRVANGEPNVALEKRELVLAKMRELGYRPNAAARAIRRGSFRTVGVVYHSLHSVGTHRSLEEISERAAESGYATTLMPLAASSGQAANGAFTRLGEMAVDVLIVILPAPFGIDEALQLPEGVPAVILGPPLVDGVATVDFDQDVGARQAVGYLLDLGHQTVHHITGPPGSFSAASRFDAWRDVLAERGRVLPAARPGDWSPGAGYRAMRQLLAEERPTAVFAANDQMALGAYRAIIEAGLRIPQDVSVLGFDDIDEAEMFAPPLTTVRQDWGLLGRESLRVALEMERGAPPEQVQLATQLVLRASTAAPAG
ncbi:MULTISPECIES: LacI family DNA-binding transcriptional regulator [Microbacterium]|uniref:Lactose operon repressor n=1 Tax=Microbacterium trichothecenolyticum TaxID=69370 RepID=A0A0M2HEW5_MICTR|nr:MULTISPECIES: LacI family DNA-binding transcriptional regulator [Microbacterium]KJL42808.1 Lactose operon repressor [Microbacterium trichothecenolyticum]MDR7187638.1 DNA-binding LacI/PurR family transcriptional regulator [Microbacterium sp. BE35]